MKMKKSFASVLKGLTAIAAAASSLTLSANVITDNITVTGGKVEEVGEEVVITFTDPETPGTLEFAKGSAAARVLVVGGGGGGGAVKANTYGAGAGGGGGGVLDKAMTERFKNFYTIYVGKGGTAAEAFPSGPTPGGDGGVSKILNIDEVEVISAKGGGGGGAGASSGGTGTGRDGGCGGGGSGTSSKPGNGGKGTSGQGYAGGSGKSNKNISGGGGGAGAKADDSETVSTAGGIGKKSDIRGLADDYFGGGGAGGDTRNSAGSGAIAGAQGGGGSGGSGDNKDSRDGENGRGGGGGGSSGTTNAAFKKPGVGGSGIVIIRLSNYQEGGVPIPRVKPISYDGEAHTPITDTDLYTVSGDVTKTDVGDYTVTLTLTAAGKELQWDDDQKTGDTRSVNWQIIKRKVEKPVLTKTDPFVFDGTTQTGFVEHPELYTLTNNQKRDAATYNVTATLVDTRNNEWADGVNDKRSDLRWAIEQLLLPAPEPTQTAGHVYSGNVQTGFVASAWYTYDANNERTDAGVYPVVVTLKEPLNATWAGDAPSLSWEIKPLAVRKPQVTTSFVFDKTEKSACVQPEEDQGKYTLSGEKATNAGAYVVVARLTSRTNYAWLGGGSDDLNLPWVIEVREIDWPPAGAQEEYPYEKGTVREPIPASDFYERRGDTAKETSGDYTTLAILTCNDLPTVTNAVWKIVSSGALSTDGKAWGWSIIPGTIAVPVPENATYAEEPRGTPKKHQALDIPSDAAYQWADGDDLVQSRAGSYSCRLELKDPVNTVWDGGSSEPRTVKWTIAKADNEVTSLSLADWQFGATPPRSPVGALKFGNPEPDWYSWGPSEEGPWTKWQWPGSVPTEAGYYFIKLDVPAAANWNATNRIESFCVWMHPSEVFTDFVDITLTGATGRDKVVELTVGPAVKKADGAVTGGLPGFEYGRTGAGGNQIRFVQSDAKDPLKDVLLPFVLSAWNTSGESKIRVKVADLAAGTTIRMYWHAKGGDPMSTNDPGAAEGAPVGATAAFSLVSRDDQLVDYWTAMPVLSRTIFDVTDPPTPDIITSRGELKDGTVVTYFLTMPIGTTNDVIQTGPGTYAIVFARKGGDPDYTIFEGEQRKEYEVIWHNTYEDLGGTLGGRILLGNNDTLPGHEITGQAYWQTDSTLSSYWEHSTEAAKTSLPNLGKGINHTLYRKTDEGPQVLWRMVNMRLGSLYPNSGTPSTSRNYLPWSETSQPRSSATAKMAPKEVSYLVMLNMGGIKYAETPAIYSPCYTNGLGMVYFDVVNAWNDDAEAQIIVEVAVQTSRGEVPTDENCANPNVPDDPYFYLSHDKDDKELSEENDMWLPLKPTVLYKAKDANEFVIQPQAGDIIRPYVTTGGGNTEFYRIMAENPYADSFVRFRIRRPAKSGTGAADTSGLILLDNVHASPPAMRADLTALGVSDEDAGRTGKQTLGMAGSLSRAFPARTDKGVFGRAKITFKTTPGIPCEKTTFIASARLNYRWRYLNQTFDKWRSVYLDHTKLTGEDGEILPTVAPLDFTGRQGDVEWFYDMTLQAPAYKYVNYSGDGVEKPLGDLSEEIRSVTNRLDLADAARQASAGTDWFVRLRDGQSDWEGFHVEIHAVDATAKPIAGEYEMELIEDNMWRALIVIPTNASGKCSFSFNGLNLHEGGDPDRITVPYRPYGAAEPGLETPIPTSGKIVENGSGVTFELDRAAGYLEFRLSDNYLTYQVGRCEYQNFNYWNDAHTSSVSGNEPKFRADTRDTNSVDVANMKTTAASIAGWTPFVPNNDWWNETFYQADYDPTPGSSRFEKEIFHATHETPNGWTAQNITFVSERFVSSGDQKTKSGLAGKLRGGGSGKIDFVGSGAATPGLERPEGLEKVTLTARLGQSYSFSSMAYDSSKDNMDNYMFFVPVTMSHRTKNTEELPADMAVGASTSVVGYYFPGFGCYEFRVERLQMWDNKGNAKMRLSIYKWYSNGEDNWMNERLCYRDFNAQAWTDDETNTKEYKGDESKFRYFGLFISLQTEYADEDGYEPTKTRIVAGISAGNPAIGNDAYFPTPWKNFEGINYRGLIYEDKDEPWGWGAYGVAAKDCPAQFIVPAYRDEPFEGTVTENPNPKDSKDTAGSGGKFFEEEIPTLGEGFVDARKEIFAKRHGWVMQDRYECFTNNNVWVGSTKVGNWYGIRTPTNIVQTIDLFLKPKGKDESQWKKYGSQRVSGYGFKDLPAIDLKQSGSWDLRLATGTGSTADVVVDNIVQYRWQAPDVNDPSKISSVDRGEEFVFSQGVVVTNTTSKKQWITLQPARAIPERPISLRGPITGGLGKFTFSYRNADKNAEVWVQVATNLVEGNLSGNTGYNNSVKSKELGEQQDVGEWLTVAKFSTAATDAEHKLKIGDAADDAKSVYVGWHDHADKPLKGLFRLFVPPATVIAATNAAGKAGNVDYGKLDVSSASCTDEPGLSDRSWRAWNMRTVGDSTDSEKRMNLVDMVIADGGYGLVAALNNSTKNVEDKDGKPVPEDDKRLLSGYPAIYSPTMHPLKPTSGVGSVTVKARLYSTTGSTETSGGGRITVWGAKDSRAEKWTKLDVFQVASPVFSNYTWAAGKELYTAIKFEVSEPSAKTRTGLYDRVILDEIVIGEKVPPTIDFVYARPFRMNLLSEELIDDILSPAEQPLSGESWGVQTKLRLQQLTDEIDVERGFEVYLSYFRGEKPWGYGNWCSNRLAVVNIPLKQVGEATNLVFRSVGDRPESLVGPSDARSEVVQFMLTVKYWDRGGKDDTQTLSVDWRQPDWFYPLDYNKKNGALDDDRNFSAYTVLDTMSPGRAWINEVSWNDGPAGQNAGRVPTDNQYVEICVPAGIDLTDWYLRVTDLNLNNKVFAIFGQNGLPGSKAPTANCTNGYEFLVLKAPNAKVPEADASWSGVTLGDNVKNGTLNYGNPYQFELMRPSGIIEHQFVLEGTNQFRIYGSFNIYDGTNLVHNLDIEDELEFPFVKSPKRFFGGADVARRAGDKLASVGVVGGEDGPDTANWPGGSNTWAEAMAFTPGRINAGQVIPKGWFIAPNGTNSWVYFSLESGHIRQNVGGDTNQTVLVVLPQGQSTNVHYEVDGWYEGAVTENDAPVASGRIGAFDWPVAPTGSLYYVRASAVPQAALAEKFGLTAENPYTPAVLKWLSKWNADGSLTAEDIRLARFMGLHGIGGWSFMDLTDMYWLDIPPVPQSAEEWAQNDGTNWWLRGGIDDFSGKDHIIKRREYRGGELVDVTYTNKQITIALYASNEVTEAVWSPTKLQGLNNESSAGDYGNSWTSVTLKVKGRLNLSETSPYLPFRTFIFGEDSFDENHRAVIDILDPFQSPIGIAYGWDKHPNSSAYFQWRIDTTYYPYSIEMLNKDSTYKGNE